MPVSGGATAARLFRIDAGGRHYLLRIEGPASPANVGGIEDPRTRCRIRINTFRCASPPRPASRRGSTMSTRGPRTSR